MTKKVFISILVSILLCLFSGMCFAATNTDNVNLGNDVSSSLQKGMNTVRNAARSTVNSGRNAVDDVGGAIDGMGSRMNTGNYTTARTSAENNMNTTGGMSTTTWMWVIFAIAAVIVIAAIWYYAMQGNDRS